MGFQTEKWPAQLRRDIGDAIAAGEKPVDVHRKLIAGTFKHHGHQPIPIETVRYYGRIERKRRRAEGISELAQQDLDLALDLMARHIFTELEQALDQARRYKNRDLDKLGKIADVARKLQPLIQRQPATDNKSKAKDPALAKLAKAARPTPSSKPQENGSGGATQSGNETQDTPTTTSNPTPNQPTEPPTPSTHHAAGLLQRLQETPVSPLPVGHELDGPSGASTGADRP